MIFGLAWRLAVVIVGAMVFYAAGTIPGDQLWLTIPAGFAIGWGVSSAYFAESDQ